VSAFAARDIEPGVAETFMELFESEVATRSGAPVIRIAGGTTDGDTAVAHARALGASHAVFGSMAALGSKIVVRATAIRVSDSALAGDAKLTAVSVEDLENVAARLATSLVEGVPVEESAELGTVLEKELEPPLRREGDHAFGFGVASMFPVTAHSAAGLGVALDLSYGYEAVSFLIQPRLGVRFSAEQLDSQHYVHVPLDLGAFWLLGKSDIALMVGGGLGVRYQWERKRVEKTVGTLLQQTSVGLEEDDAWGVGMFARVGAMFFRTFSLRLLAYVDVDATFARTHGQDYPVTVVLGLGLLL
jgi:hypothetical protein